VKVAEVTRETHDIASIVLADLDGSPLPHALPGQYLALRCRPKKNSPIVRSYSISGASDAGVYRISVKRGAGPDSQYLVLATQVSDKLQISSPLGDFILHAGGRPVVLLGAGIGITSVLSMLHGLASRSAQTPRKVWWVHAACNAAEQVFAQEARQLLSAIPGNHSAIAYSKPNPADRLGSDFDVQGR
jgi:ferredoxin-NADP reductase